MPIKAENKKRYPKNWRWIRMAILNRAGNRCEGSPAFPLCQAENGKPHPDTQSRVVLTIAHLDHQPENCDGLEKYPIGLIVQPYTETPKERSNLRAWCQRCHLKYDAKHHAKNGRKTQEIAGEIDYLYVIAKHAAENWHQITERESILSNLAASCEGFLRAIHK